MPRPSGARVPSRQERSKALRHRLTRSAPRSSYDPAAIEAAPRTWHYGLIAKWWSEFNDDFRPHELPYFRKFVEDDGQPALDVGCGSGRLLLPYLQAGLDVDGCDVSADMIAVCREKAERLGLSPSLYVQPMHELDLPRRYRTIFVCGSFGLGSTREQCFQALDRFRAHLSPGGTLLVDMEVPYAEAGQWKYWLAEERAALPEAAREPRQRRAAPDGAEYALSSRIVALDPLRQHVTLEMRAQMWRDDTLEAEETHALDISLFFPSELRLMLERAGFESVVVHGEHEEREPTSADEFVVLFARRS